MDANIWEQKLGSEANSPRKLLFLLMKAAPYLTCICAQKPLGIAHLVAGKKLSVAWNRVRNT